MSVCPHVCARWCRSTLGCGTRGANAHTRATHPFSRPLRAKRETRDGDQDLCKGPVLPLRVGPETGAIATTALKAQALERGHPVSEHAVEGSGARYRAIHHLSLQLVAKLRPERRAELVGQPHLLPSEAIDRVICRLEQLEIGALARRLCTCNRRPHYC